MRAVPPPTVPVPVPIPSLLSIKPPPQRCFLSFAASAKSQLPENRDDKDVKVECRQNNVDGVLDGEGVLAAFKSKAQQQQKHKPSPSSSQVRPKPSSTKKQGHELDERADGGGVERRRQLSGSDVLWALQRASAEKAKKQRKKRGNANRQQEMRAVEIGDDHNTGTNTASLEPWSLRIKSEWGVRLGELEKRLEELILMDV